MILLILRGDVNNVLTEEQCGFMKGRRCVDRVFTLTLIIEKCLSHQTPLVLSFTDYEKVFDSADRRALAKVLSLYSIPDKYTKVITVMYENSPALVKVGNEASSSFRIKSGDKQICFLSPFMWIILLDSVSRSTGKAMGVNRIKWRRKLSWT
ncbi:uncharacterized protein LOC136043046 [Artemia franciscana]|uniref:uncharacterized protein LOC136043046 n=1 Tax=Artemia franciscana TaxID=6661 RepID=UPI0032DBA21E